jgi:hypothetical protein
LSPAVFGLYFGSGATYFVLSTPLSASNTSKKLSRSSSSSFFGFLPNKPPNPCFFVVGPLSRSNAHSSSSFFFFGSFFKPSTPPNPNVFFGFFS